MRTLAFDLGGTFLRSAVTGCGHALDAFVKLNLTDVVGRAGVWDSVMNAIISYEAAQRHKLPDSAPIVFAFPGPVAANRRILQAPTVAGSADVPDIANELEKRTGRTVHLLNDISAAAWYFAECTEARRFLVVTISSGIGSKLFDHNHPSRVLDDPPYAGEIGHFVVDESPDAIVCDCGAKGHLGGIASGRGIERAARLRAVADPSGFASSKASQFAKGGILNNEHHIVPAAATGDQWTWRIIEDCTRPLARTILATVMVAGLDRVFIVGGFAQALGTSYQRLLTRLIAESSGYAVVRDRLESLVRLVDQDENTCLKGCGIYARNHRVTV